MPKVATLIFNLDNSDANGTTYDATVTDLGDVTGFYYNFAAQDLDGTENVDRYEHAGCGGIDSGGDFDCYSVCCFDENGVGTSDSDRQQRLQGTSDIYLLGTMRCTVSRITDGLRLTKVSDNAPPSGGSVSREIQLCLHVVSGGKVAVGTATLPNSSTVTLTTNASDGTGNIDTNTCFIFSGCTTLTNGIGEIALPSYGFGQRITDSSFRQWNQNWHSPQNVGTSNITSRFSTSYIMAQISLGTVDYSAPITSWTANGSTSAIQLTTSGSAGSDRIGYIAFEDTIKGYVDNKLVNAFTSSPITLTGSSSTGVAPKHLHIGGMSVSNDDTNDTSSTASTCQFYWKSEKSSSASISRNNNYGFSADGVGTMVCQSKNENNSGPKITYYSGYEQTLLAGTTAFGSQDASFTVSQIDYSANVPFGYFLLSDDWTDDVTMDADAATFTLTGQSADLRVVTKMSAAAASFSLTGQTAAYGFGTVASAGSFALTGVAAELLLNTVLDAAAGSFSLTLQMPSIGLTVDATTQNYVVTGVDATLDDGDDSLSAETGSFSVTGKQAFYGVTLGTAAGSFQLSGSFTTLIDSGSIVATPIYYRFLMQEE